MQADARRIPLQDGCVQCVVTSPPYFGLRDYGTARWEGGDLNCDHKPDVKPRTDRPRNGLTGGLDYMAAKDPSFRDLCGKCGAIRHDSQIGLEPSPDAYVAALVAVFREVGRVLADDGVCWLNLGDSYVANRGNTPERPGHDNKSVHSTLAIRDWNIPGKQKDLIGIPWRVAFALQSDGWYLRSDVIWSKPNPMPESVTDRPTRAHEYVFLLTKSERYYYDADAVAEPAIRAGQVYRPSETTMSRGQAIGANKPMSGNALKDVLINGAYRNVRSVWTFATQPYTGAHFATMPEKLAERCILAGSRPGDLVLDPFGGSGTTVRVARRLNRRGVMLDLNPAYLELARQRISHVQQSILDVPEEASA